LLYRMFKKWIKGQAERYRNGIANIWIVSGRRVKDR
jgi:hypothetical protein